MRFGQSLFAGAAAAGFITAAGVALCSSSAFAAQEVRRFAAGNAQSVVTARAASSRLIEAGAVGIAATAKVAGSPIVNFHATGLSQAVATASGYVRGNSYGYANATGVATAVGAALKSTKQYPYHASCTALASDSAVVWDIGVAMSAVANATGLGTTWYLGYGYAVATAGIDGIAKQQAGGSGLAVGTAECEGSALYTLGARNTAHALAILSGDAAVTKAGIRYFEALGDGFADAGAVITTTSVYQSQTAIAAASIEARAVYIIGLVGRGYGIANASGEALAASTTVAGVPSYVYAYASAKAQYAFSGAGSGLAIATAAMNKSSVVTSTAATPGPAQAKAVANGKATKRHVFAGTAVASCVAKASSTKVVTVQGYARAYSAAAISSIALAVRGAYLNASATATGSGHRFLTDSGAATAYALAVGVNQINDLVRAPGDRTLYVEFVGRLYALETQDRTLIV